MRSVVAVGIAVASALVGCDRSLGPRSDLTVRVDSVGPPATAFDQAGQPAMVCPVHLTAVSSSASRLDWIASVFHYYPGGDTTEHGDSSILMPEAIWQAAEVLPGQRRSITWMAAAPAPYFGVVEFRFQDASIRTGYGVAAVSFACGVAGARAGTGVGSPTITLFSTAPKSPHAVPGEPYLYFKLAAIDTNGLWTAAVIDAPVCSWPGMRLMFPDLPKTFSSTGGALGMFIPPGCGPGPVTITVTVRNAFLHQTVDTLIASLP